MMVQMSLGPEQQVAVMWIQMVMMLWKGEGRAYVSKRGSSASLQTTAGMQDSSGLVGRFFGSAGGPGGSLILVPSMTTYL